MSVLVWSLLEGARRVRSVRALLVACVAIALGPVVAKLSPSSGASAADDALRAGVFGIALPLAAYLSAEAVLQGKNLDQAARRVARYGVSGRLAGLGLVLALAAVSIAAALLGCVAALLSAYPAHGSDFYGDLFRSLPIAATAGAAYAGWYALASCFGARGGGRKWLLGLDWVLGATSGIWAAPWPRGHVRNLLGGSPVLELSQAGAFGVLLLGTSLAVLAALAHSHD
ncbi:MAG: hypothetical protein M3020_10955 [Myxococcota bacterium]|nr:hypothetical protein [Myxococcota bacterium]